MGSVARTTCRQVTHLPYIAGNSQYNLPHNFLTSISRFPCIFSYIYLQCDLLIVLLSWIHHVELTHTYFLSFSHNSPSLSPHLCSVTFLIVLLSWIVQVEGGLGFANPMSVFGWHALCMSGFVVVFSQVRKYITHNT